MKRLLLYLFLIALPEYIFAQLISLEEFDLYSNSNATTTLQTDKNTYVPPSVAQRIRQNDVFRAFIPGAVQMRRKWPVVAEAIWGGMAISGGITAYEHFHIIKLQHDSDNDPSNANWYDGKIRQSKKVRNASLYALGGIYIANYVSALLLPDRDPRTSWISFYADPQGTFGLYLAFSF